MRGQFARQVVGVDVDLGVQPATVDDSDEDEEEEGIASRDSYQEDDVSRY